jgi:hypothetical protein
MTLQDDFEAKLEGIRAIFKELKGANEGLRTHIADLQKENKKLRSPKPQEEEFYHVGQRFTDTQRHFCGVFLLAQTESCVVNLLDIDDGNRFTNSMSVANSSKIPTKDFHKHFNTDRASWKLVS